MYVHFDLYLSTWPAWKLAVLSTPIRWCWTCQRTHTHNELSGCGFSGFDNGRSCCTCILTSTSRLDVASLVMIVDIAALYSVQPTVRSLREFDAQPTCMVISRWSTLNRQSVALFVMIMDRDTIHSFGPTLSRLRVALLVMIMGIAAVHSYLPTSSIFFFYLFVKPSGPVSCTVTVQNWKKRQTITQAANFMPTGFSIPSFQCAFQGCRECCVPTGWGRLRWWDGQVRHPEYPQPAAQRQWDEWNLRWDRSICVRWVAAFIFCTFTVVWSIWVANRFMCLSVWVVSFFFCLFYFSFLPVSWLAVGHVMLSKPEQLPQGTVCEPRPTNRLQVEDSPLFQWKSMLLPLQTKFWCKGFV